MKLFKALRNLSLLVLFVGNTNLIYAGKIVPDTSISCSKTGTAFDHSGTDGCGFIILLDDGTVLQPVNIIQNIVLRDSMRVALHYYFDSTVATTCQFGIPVVIDCIRELKPGPLCEASFKYEKVRCEKWDSLGFGIRCGRYQYHFTAVTQVQNPSMRWFVDGVNVISGIEMYYDFQKPGTYNVCLEVIGAYECSLYTCQQLIIEDSSECDVSFTWDRYDLLDSSIVPVYPDWELTYKLNGEVTGGNGAEWYWSLNDSIFSMDQNTVYTFPDFGEYEVCLSVVTASGCQSSVCHTVKVDTFPLECKAGFVAWPIVYWTTKNNSVMPDTGTGYLNGYFFENRSITYFQNTNYVWDFGDGTTSQEYSPIHYFTGSGPFMVCLKMDAGNGQCTDTYCKTIIIDSVEQCNAYFTYCNYNMANDIPVIYDSLSPDSNNYKTYIIGFKNLSTPEYAGYYWDFGDGSTSSQKNPVHKYNSPGSYYVCLSVSSWSGCYSTYCEWINVGIEDCKIDFDVDIMVPLCGGFEIAHLFTPYSNKEITSYSWSFGDGEYAWEEQPFHMYSNYGVYEVCVDAYTYDGCYARACKYVYVSQDTINYEFKSKCGQSPIHDLVADESLSIKQIYPMPATDNIDLKLNSDIDQLVTVEIIDMLGRRHPLANDYQVDPGENIINLNVEQFAPGTYQIIISAKEKILRGNIVITE